MKNYDPGHGNLIYFYIYIEIQKFKPLILFILINLAIWYSENINGLELEMLEQAALPVLHLNSLSLAA